MKLPIGSLLGLIVIPSFVAEARRLGKPPGNLSLGHDAPLNRSSLGEEYPWHVSKGFTLLELQQGMDTPSQEITSQDTLRSCFVGGTAALLLMLGWSSMWDTEGKGKEKQVLNTIENQPESADADQSSRFYLLDNAKAFLMFLVVYGHFLHYSYMGVSDDEETWLSGSSEGLRHVFLAFNGIPVPMFCFISGLLSQGPVTQDRLRRFVQFFLVPVVLWILVVKQFVLGAMGDPQLHTLKEVFMATTHLKRFEVRGYEWFLITLAIWRASVFLIWSHLRPSVALGCAVVLSSIIGYKDIGMLNVTLALLPYFMAGYILPLRTVCDATERSYLVCRLVVLLSFLTWFLILQPMIFTAALPSAYGSYACCEAGPVFLSTTGKEYALYWTRKVARVALDNVFILALLLFLIPRRRMPFSFVGQHCLYPYLFHGVALQWRENLIHAFPPPVVTSAFGHVVVLCLHVPFVLMILGLFAGSPWRWIFSWCFAPTWMDSLLKTAMKD